MVIKKDFLRYGNIQIKVPNDQEGPNANTFE